MTNDQAHDTRVSTAPERVAQAVGLSVAAVASGGGGGDPVAGFTAETGFSLTDNGDGTYKITDAQSRFGTKPNAVLPVWFIDFGAGDVNPHPTLSRTQKVLPWNPVCTTTNTLAKSGSTHSMIIDTDADGGPVFDSEGELKADEALQLPSNSGRKYFRHIDYYNDFLGSELDAATGGALNLKCQRWQPNDLNQTTDPYTGITMQATGGNFYHFDFARDGAGTYTSSMFGFSELSTKRWRAEEEYHETSSATGVADAVMIGVLDGVKKFTRANVDSHDGQDPIAFQWGHYKLANFNIWAATGVCPWLYDILYIDDSWCRVYITDKPTWDEQEAKALEIQIPTGWTAGELDFHFRLGALASTSGNYLWAVDNNDTKILIGGWS